MRTVIQRTLVLGHIGRQFAVQAPAPGGLVTAELSELTTDGPPAISILDAASSRSTRLRYAGSDLVPTSSLTLADPTPIWRGTTATPGFRQALRLFPVDEYEALDVANLAPLALLHRHDAGGTSVVDVLVPSKLTAEQILFARTASHPIATSAGPADLLATVLPLESPYDAFVHNHSLNYTKATGDDELEVKLTFEDATASIWEIVTDLYARYRDGSVPNFVCEFGNEFQRWQRSAQMYEVVEPADQAGYISFIQNPNGTYAVKHKRFTEDSLRRAESFRHQQRVRPEQFDEYLKTHFPGAVLRKLPAYRRTRLDVNIESVLSGVVYSISVDECTVDSSPSTVLRQVEIEYVRSRVLHQPADMEFIEQELMSVVGSVQEYLERRGFKVRRGYYSKLSFLRDHAMELVDGGTAG